MILLIIGLAGYGGFTMGNKKQPTLAERNEQQKAADIATNQQRAKEIADAARAAAQERTERISAIREQIAEEEAAKSDVGGRGSLRQKHLNAQNEKIRLLQDELWKLGVAGAAFERR